MFKKLMLSMSVVAALVAGVVALPSSGYYVSYFTDVPPDHPYFTEIDYLRSSKIALGYGDQTFHPYQVTTRAEFVTMVVKAIRANADPAVFNNCFTDVGSEWFANEVCYAKAAKWLNFFGSESTSFSPNAELNYDQARSILVSAYGTVPANELFSSPVSRQEAARMLYLLRGVAPAAQRLNLQIPQQPILIQQQPTAIPNITYLSPAYVDPTGRAQVQYVAPAQQVPVPVAYTTGTRTTQSVRDNRDAYSAYNTFYNYYTTGYSRPAYAPVAATTYPMNNGYYDAPVAQSNNNSYAYGYGTTGTMVTPNGYYGY